MRRALAVAGLALLLAGCGGAAASGQAEPSLHVYASSATATPEPTIEAASPLPALPTPTAIAPTPTVTPGPIAYVITTTTDRRNYTLHVGDAIRLELTSGPSSDWLSGVDDARVLAPVSPQMNGVYQAIAPGTTLLTAHVMYGCPKANGPVPCEPENGLWYQTRVYVLP